MQSHCQQGGEIDLGPGIEVVTALQSTDELQTQTKRGNDTDPNLQIRSLQSKTR